jgi:hypothetical protein
MWDDKGGGEILVSKKMKVIECWLIARGCWLLSNVLTRLATVAIVQLQGLN